MAAVLRPAHHDRMANGERLEVVKGKLFCSSKVISGKLYIPQRFATSIKWSHTVINSFFHLQFMSNGSVGALRKMEQKQGLSYTSVHPQRITDVMTHTFFANVFVALRLINQRKSLLKSLLYAICCWC